MPQVELCHFNIRRGVKAEDFNLFLPFCVHKKNHESKEENEIGYEAEYFRQTIQRVRDAYPSKILNILIADSLDRYNRCAPEDILITKEQLKAMSEDEHAARDERLAAAKAEAIADGDHWLNMHKPILDELGLRQGHDYHIYRWDDFLESDEGAKKSGYLQEFEQKAVEQRTVHAIRSAAKKYAQEQVYNYNFLPKARKKMSMEVSCRYFLEDLAVSFYISQKCAPTLFLSDKQKRQFRGLVEQCNSFDLGFIHLQLRIDKEKEVIKGNGTIVPINGNRVAMFQPQPQSQVTTEEQGIQNRIQVLHQIRFDIVRSNTEMLQKQLAPLNEEIAKLSQRLTQLPPQAGVTPR